MGMKHEKISIEFRRKTRAHKVLFDRELPFHPRVVKSKLQYRRREKHLKSYSVDQ